MLQYKTRGNAGPQGKQKVYFTFENCALWYLTSESSDFYTVPQELKVYRKIYLKKSTKEGGIIMNSIFVSSTFRDMHFERDILNREIGPKLNYFLSKYNKAIRISDLRWGVDTSDLSEKEAAERVLAVCFDEIDKCKPYIIILLGDRYGYIPDSSGLSVTHMEIIRGAIENTEQDHIFVYFRNADYSNMPEDVYGIFVEQDADAKSKLDRLKAELYLRMPSRCHEYSARWSDVECRMVSDDFNEIVYGDLEAEFVREFIGFEHQSQLQQQLDESEELLGENLQFAFKNEDMLKTEVLSVIDANEPYGIIGDAGEGKSIYMSLLCSKLREYGHRTWILFCGDNAFSASVRNAAEYVLYALVTSSGKKYDFESCSVLEYNELLAEIINERDSVKGKSYILFDAIDKCDEGMVNFILWCGRYLFGQIKIVFSSRVFSEISDSEKSFILRYIQYGKEDLQSITRCLLSRYGKAVNEELINLISERVSNPLQLNIILQRLLNLSFSDYEIINKNGGGIDAINSHLCDIIVKSSVDIRTMISNLLNSLLESSSNGEFALNLIYILALSEYGLPENDLKDLCERIDQKWVQLDYIDFLAKFSFFIRVRDSGRLDISHDIIRQTFRVALESQGGVIYGKIAMYYLYRKTQDMFSIRTFFHAAYNGGQRRHLVEFIVNHYDLFDYQTKSNSSVGKEMRKCILRTFMLDDGVFLMESSQMCKNEFELMMFQSALSTSLLSVNDYLSEDEILKLVKVVMALPLTVDTYPADMAEMDFFSCEQLLYRHGIMDKEAEEFLEVCRRVIGTKKELGPDASKEKEDADSIERMFSTLHTPDANHTNKVLCMEGLTTIGRSMASDDALAEKAEALLTELLKCDITGILEDEGVGAIIYANIYTSLGVLYKTQKKWSEALRCDQMSLEICRKLYENNPSHIFFRKYRERVYNIANITEAWAMQERINTELWQKTRERYEEIYRLDVIAVGLRISEREVLQCASAILSYGTAMLNTGDHDGCLQKYEEGINLILDLAANHPRNDLYLEICQHLMECVYQLSRSGRYDEAVAFSADICKYLTEVVGCGQNKFSDEVMTYVISFSNVINSLLSELFRENNIDDSLKLSRILCRVYQAVLPIASHEIKVNIMHTQRNIGDMLFLKNEDYRQAFEEYRKLFRLVREHDLACQDDSGRFNDQINLRLGDPYIRMFIFLYRLGEKEALGKMLDEMPEYGEYIAKHTETYKDDPAVFLYIVGLKLAEEHRAIGLATLMQAFGVTCSETYDKEKHAGTVFKIMMAIANLSHAARDDDNQGKVDE